MRTRAAEQHPTAEAEKHLVRRMLAGDEDAFDCFMEDHVPPLHRFALRRLRDPEWTREIVQTTVCKAIAKLDSFRGEAALGTWLCAICKNEIAAHFRQRGRAGVEVELTEEVVERSALPGAAGPPGPEQELLVREREELVHVALDALPAHYARALEWKYLERLAVEQIALRLGMGAKAVESLLTRARAAFRREYGRLASGYERPVAGWIGATGRGGIGP